jgi:hypothetical protein
LNCFQARKSRRGLTGHDVQTDCQSPGVISTVGLCSHRVYSSLQAKPQNHYSSSSAR